MLLWQLTEIINKFKYFDCYYIYIYIYTYIYIQYIYRHIFFASTWLTNTIHLPILLNSVLKEKQSIMRYKGIVTIHKASSKK